MKYLKKTFIILPLIFLLACVEKPEELRIPTDIIVSVLSDAHIAEGAMLSVRPKLKDSVRNFYYQQIFEMHGIDSLSFVHDMEILKENPKIMEKIYSKVSIQLSIKEKELTNKGKEKNK